MENWDSKRKNQDHEEEFRRLEDEMNLDHKNEGNINYMKIYF